MYSPYCASPELGLFVDNFEDDFEINFQLESSVAGHDTHIFDYRQNLDIPEDINMEMEQGFEDSTDDSSDSSISTQSSPTAIHHIEEVVLSFLRQLAFPGGQKIDDESSEHSSDPVNQPPLRSDHKIEIFLADRKKIDAEGIFAMKCLRFPKKSGSASSKPFAQLFRALDLAHEAKLSEVPATKRDIYYKDVPLFKSQRVVDTLVDDIAATFQIERSDLNIVKASKLSQIICTLTFMQRSSSKGLICGSGLTMTLLSGECVRCNDSEGTLVPAGEDIETFSVDEDVAWVLIIEKEAVFQTLCRVQISKHERMPGPGIMITGKGYPDVATRHIVKSLADALPRSIPIMALVDGDPFGLDILSVYKYGSKGMQHENEKLATRRIKWLGVWASELERLGVNKDNLLPINKHDEKKALSMLHRENVPRKWRKELQHMLHNRHKAEIEILSSHHTEVGNTPSSGGEKDEESKPDHIDLIGVVGLSESNTGTQCTPHALLLHYLQLKVTKFVTSAGHSGGEARE